MNSTLRILLIGLVLGAGTLGAAPAEACPMCKVAHEDSTDPAVAARPRAYMYSILFMLAMPATIFSSFGVAFYRMSKKQSALNAAALTEYGLGDRRS